MFISQLFKYWTLKIFAPGKLLRQEYGAFKELLRHDKRSLELITELEDLLRGDRMVDWARVESLARALSWSAGRLIDSLMTMHPAAYADLEERFHQIDSSLLEQAALPAGDAGPPYAVTLAEAAGTPELTGGKAHTLGRLLNETGLPGPQGLVVTTNAFRYFLERNQLRRQMDELLAQVQLDDWDRLVELSQEMTALVQQGDIPPEVVQEIARRLEHFRRQGLWGPWALRSSALSEDGAASFAGQYVSVLGVGTTEIGDAYKRVLASKYSPTAVAYRIRNGLADQDTPMAVLLLEMINAAVSGVVYSRSPETSASAEAYVEVFALSGLGNRLMDGSSLAEIYRFSREENPRLLESQSDISGLGGGAGLALDIATELARWGMRLEKLEGCPQDIEWCQDQQGKLYLLQSRPLTGRNLTRDDRLEEIKRPEIGNPVLLAGGIKASPGLGMGRVCLVQGIKDLAAVPEGSVLVSPTMPPDFAGIIQRLRAVVAEMGSRASHFAMVAREYGLPVIVGAKEATKLLPSGRLVTVDADQCRVYLGEVTGLQGQPRRPHAAAASPFVTRLQRVMEFVAPLHLTDPHSPAFAPRGCRSFHDLVRFVHEKGMAEMFSLADRQGRGMTRARRLDTDLPLVMYVLDLEGGISPEAGPGKDVRPQFIISEPMRAFWQGLSHPDVAWDKRLLHIDWEELDRLNAGLVNLRSAALASYAIISKGYLHLVLRFGYHFAIIDSLCSDDPEANYITFRFKGGGGNYENRLLRIRLIKDVLEWAGFEVHTQGDLLNSRFQRREAGQTLSRLTLLGLLQGKTRLLDIALSDEDGVSQMVSDFKERYQEYVAYG